MPKKCAIGALFIVRLENMATTLSIGWFSFTRLLDFM